LNPFGKRNHSLPKTKGFFHWGKHAAGMKATAGNALENGIGRD